MDRIIKCKKYGEELPGLTQPPYPGELGQKIFDEFSQKAWDAWVEHQTKLINEYKLKVFEPSAQAYLKSAAEAFFFGKPEPEPPQAD